MATSASSTTTTEADRLATFRDALSQRFPADRLLTGATQLSPYESDALTAFRDRPDAVVLVESADEVVATVRLCHEHGVPFVARGSGTSLSGGALPIAGGVVIALNRLNRVLAYHPEHRTIVVEPGFINLQVSQRAANEGLHYAPDPSSGPVCTIGGNVAFNSGGAHCLKYGMTANHVLGIKAVLPDGEVVELGGQSLEMAGPDLTGMFVGSEGLFGIALEITLQLIPKPERYHTVLAAYDTLAKAGDAVAMVVASGLLPGAMEIMDHLAIEASEAAVHAGYPTEAAAALIVELEGPAEEVEAEIPLLDKVIQESSAYQVRVARNAAERMTIWKGRKCAFSAVGRLSPDYIVQDGVVPRTRLGEALGEIERLGRQYDLRIANVFHAGDGNLHPLILYDGRVQGQWEQAERLAGEILRMCIRFGGSITGEHGVGVEKIDYLPQMYGQPEMQLLKRVRQAVDPAELANRGKMLEVTAGDAKCRPAPHPLERRESLAGPDREVTTRMQHVTTSEEVAELVRSQSRLRVTGGGTKSATSSTANVSLSGLSGVLQYDPAEFTFTALAGTRLGEVEQLLLSKKQYLPFDPPLVDVGATLGGTVAAGLSGSGRFRYGGVRDFLLGVQMVTAGGEVVSTGSKVVKNAAGFDFPKLMVGSLGRFGVMTELTLKVFPAPQCCATIVLDTEHPAQAVELMKSLANSQLHLACLDMDPSHRIWTRVGGIGEAVAQRAERVLRFAGGNGTIWTDEQDADTWRACREFRWAPDEHSLVKAAITPDKIVALNAAWDGLPFRICAGGHLAWLAWPQMNNGLELDKLLCELGCAAVALTGEWTSPWIGRHHGKVFDQRLVTALDPHHKFSLSEPVAT